MGIARRFLAVTLSVGIAMSGALAVAPAASAADNGDWAAFPERPDTAAPSFTPRQYFFFDVAPGAEVKDVVTMTNATRAPLVLDVYAADAYNIRAGGGFAITPITADPKDVGSWITLSKDRVVVPAAAFKKVNGKRILVDGKVNVPFTMKVPKGATPGDHAGAITTLEPEPSADQPGASGANIAVRRALSVRTYARVSGPLNPQLLITDVKYTKLTPATMPLLGNQGTASIEYTYANTGNVRMTPLTTVSYKGFLGRTLHTTGQKPSPEILPGETITLTSTVNGMPVLDQVTARVEMKGDAAADRALAGVDVAGDDVGWVISWVFVAVVIVLIIAFVLWRRSKRKSTPQVRGKRARVPETSTP